MKTVKAVYFSATETTQKVVCRIADKLAAALQLPVQRIDFTLPQNRRQPLVFSRDDLVVFGTPVYAGRIPNVLLKYLLTMQGNGAKAVAVVLYGNRNFDDALIELRDLLDDAGARTVAAAAFIGEHAFSQTLAAGRPDKQDLQKTDEFAVRVKEKLAQTADTENLPLLPISGRNKEERKYFQPQDRHGNPIDIRKVLPEVDRSRCRQFISDMPCNICARVCPMGSVNPANVTEYTGICIKCGACIKKCPQQARFYTDSGYLYHKTELEAQYTTPRRTPQFFL